MTVTDHPVQVIPGTVETAVAWHQTGLAGTIGYRIVDNVGITTLARTITGISEYPAGSGIYQATVPNFGNEGFYTIVWDDFTRYDAIPLTVIGASSVFGVSAVNMMLTVTTAGIVPSTGDFFGAAAMTETLTVTTSGAPTMFGAASLTVTATIVTAGIAFEDEVQDFFGITSLTQTLTITTAGTLDSGEAFDLPFATPVVAAAVYGESEPELVGAFAGPFA